MFEVVATKDDRAHNITKVCVDTTQVPLIIERKKFDDVDVKLRGESGQRWGYGHEAL